MNSISRFVISFYLDISTEEDWAVWPPCGYLVNWFLFQLLPLLSKVHSTLDNARSIDRFQWKVYVSAHTWAFWNSAFKTLALMCNYSHFYSHFWALHTNHTSIESTLEVIPGRALTNQGLSLVSDVWIVSLVWKSIMHEKLIIYYNE